VKINNTGKIDAALKHKLNENVTGVVVTSLNVSDIRNQKAAPLPIGLSFDLKL